MSALFSCLSETNCNGDKNQYLGKYDLYGPHHYATNQWQPYISYEGQCYENGAI